MNDAGYGYAGQSIGRSGPDLSGVQSALAGQLTQSSKVGALSEIDAVLSNASELTGTLLKRVAMMADDLFGPSPEQDGPECASAGGGRIAATADLARNLAARLQRLDRQINRLGNLN